MSEPTPQLDDRTSAIRAAIAAELRAEIGRKNLTQSQVAERVGMSPITINRLLNEKRTVDVIQLFDFAEGLGFDIGDLVRRARRNYAQEMREGDGDRSVLTSMGEGRESLDIAIGARLRRERNDRKLSRAQVAKAAGVSDKTIQRIEDGTRSADMRQIAAILAVLGLSLDNFVAQALKSAPL